MLMGPDWFNTYSRPILALPHQLFERVFKVRVLLTLKMVRICKWSCKFSPTPGKSTCKGMPMLFKCVGSPMPESCKIWGLPILPAQRMTSCLACTINFSWPVNTSTPEHRWPPSAEVSSTTRPTCARVHISKLSRP